MQATLFYLIESMLQYPQSTSRPCYKSNHIETSFQAQYGPSSLIQGKISAIGKQT